MFFKTREEMYALELQQACVLQKAHVIMNFQLWKSKSTLGPEPNKAFPVTKARWL